jgi:hypothetical protein
MGKIILSCFLLVFVLMFTPLAEAGQEINGCPVPDNLKIIEPDSNVVPPKLALLSGIWEGSWARPAIFIVEKIQGNEAVVVHAWSGTSSMGRAQGGVSFTPGFVRQKCPIEQGDDGNYRITLTLKTTGIYKLIQTNDPSQIRVLREGYGTIPTQYRDSIFRKKEMK